MIMINFFCRLCTSVGKSRSTRRLTPPPSPPWPQIRSTGRDKFEVIRFVSIRDSLPRSDVRHTSKLASLDGVLGRSD